MADLIEIGLAVNTEQLERGASDAEGRLDDISRAADEARKRLGEVSKGMDEAGDAAAGTASQTDELKRQTEELGKQQAGTGGLMDELSRGMGRQVGAAAGLSRQLQTMIERIGMLAGGTGFTLAVIAGVAAITTAYNRLTEASRAAAEAQEEAQEELSKRLRAAIEDERGITDAKNLQLALQSVVDAQRKLDKVMQRTAVQSELSGRGPSATNLKALADATEQLRLRREEAVKQQEIIDKKESEARLARQRDIDRAQAAAAAAEKARINDTAAAQRAADNERKRALAEQQAYEAAIAREAAIALRARLDGLDQLNAAELTLRLATARATGDTAAEDAALHDQAMRQIERQMAAAQGLTEAERERLQAILEQTLALSEQAKAQQRIDENLARFSVVDRLSKPTSVQDFLGAETETDATGMLTRALGSAFRDNQVGAAAAEVISRAIEQAFRDNQRGAAALAGGIAAGVAAGIQAGSGGSAAGGLVGGASGGYAAGGPIGAVVGAVGGVVSGLIHHGQKMREAEEAYRRTVADFTRSLDQYIKGATRSTGIAQDLADVSDRAIEQQRQARDIAKQRFDQALKERAGGQALLEVNNDLLAALAKISQAEALYTQQLMAEAAAKAADLSSSLLLRETRAKGLGDEADAMQRAIDHAREFAEAQRDLGDAFTPALQAQMRYVQGLEDEAAARAIADREAQAAAEAAQRAADELQRAADEAARLAAEAERIAQVNARMQEDLTVRRLRATGADDAADAMQRELEKRREIEAALADGASEATIELLKQVQALEDQKTAAEKAAEAAAKLAEAVEAEARATEALEVRHLRATGAIEAASDLQLRLQQEEEMRRALEDGRSADYIELLRQIQAEERDAVDRARRDAASAALQSALDQATQDTSTVSSSVRSISLGQGVSEGTAGEMVAHLRTQTSYMATQTGYQASLPRIERMLMRMLPQGQPVGDWIDEMLGENQNRTDMMAGLPPGNR